MIERVLKQIPSGSRGSKPVLNALYLLAVTDTAFRRRVDSHAEQYSKLYPESAARPGLKKDMIKAYIGDGFSLDEYVDYRYFDRSAEERKDYVSRDELYRTFSSGAANTFPRDKYSRYLLFRDFFHREVLKISFDGSGREREEFSGFTARHQRFVVKPLKGVKGHGVEILTADQMPDLDALANHIHTEVLLEEVIVQGDDLGRFHPESINTLRLVSGMDAHGGFSLLYALFRTGRGGSVVDNVGSGGLICLVDSGNGRVISDGLYNHHYYASHPDTNIVFKGTQIPMWSSVLSEAQKAHETVPGQMMIGWDFAWSNKGWDLVEANPAPSFSSYQSLAGAGIRPLLIRAGLKNRG